MKPRRQALGDRNIVGARVTMARKRQSMFDKITISLDMLNDKIDDLLYNKEDKEQ